MGSSFKRWNTESISIPSGHGIYFSTHSGYGIFPCEPLGIFFRGWDKYSVLRLKEAYTLVGKSQQSLKSFPTCQMKNYMKRNRHRVVSYISCRKTKINPDFTPEAEIQARHLKNFLKEALCVCVCVFLTILLWLCTSGLPLPVALPSLKHCSLVLLVPVYLPHPTRPRPSCEVLQGSIHVSHHPTSILSTGPDRQWGSFHRC